MQRQISDVFCSVLSSVSYHVLWQGSHLSAVVFAPCRQQRGWDVTRVPDTIKAMHTWVKAIGGKAEQMPKRGWMHFTLFHTVIVLPLISTMYVSLIYFSLFFFFTASMA